MFKRANKKNEGGNETVAGGSAPASAFITSTFTSSRATGLVAAPVVVSNGHAVEIDSDGGIWDTVSNVNVDIGKTNIGSINL